MSRPPPTSPARELPSRPEHFGNRLALWRVWIRFGWDARRSERFVGIHHQQRRMDVGERIEPRRRGRHYGTKGTAGDANIPGSRYGRRSLRRIRREISGLFGGRLGIRPARMEQLNDLWEFSTVSKEWTWIERVECSRTSHGSLWDAGHRGVRQYPRGAERSFSVGPIRREISGSLAGLVTIRLLTQQRTGRSE